MAHENHYKKIFVITAALFIIFTPVGMTIKNGTKDLTANFSPSASPYSAFRLSFNLNLATAATRAPSATIGAGAGQTQATSQTPNFFSCTMSPASCAVYYVSLFVNGIMALFITLGAWLVELGLQFNSNIFNAPAIQIGFSISLAIANLGFVLGIIIIAIATIIRNQTYGIKQLLWKLVVMAILVNFGLVITAPIVGFANNMSNYFINASAPSTATGGYSNYVLALTGAFNPQTTISAPTAGTGAWTSICQSFLSSPIIGSPGLYLICKATGTPTTNPADNFWQNNIAMIFDIIFSAIAVFVFACLAILLIIRYLMLGGLLIVLPLAWLTYIFPKFDNSFSKWWNTFIKWTFFPPLALFFIYLAFTTAVTTNTANNNAATKYTASAIGGGTNIDIQNSLATQTGLVGPKEGVFAQAADEVLLAGLMIMGLMFALSLSGKAGSTVVNGAGAVSKAAAGYVGKKTGRLYQKAGGGDLNKTMQQSRIPGFSAIGRGMTNLTERATKNQVDAQHKALGFGAMDDDRLQAVTQGLHGKEAQLAAVQEWQKRGKLDKIESIGGDNFSDWLKKNQGTFKNYSQDKLRGDIDSAMGSNDKIRRTAGVMAGARATISTEEIEKTTNGAQVVDKNGIMGVADKIVSAKDLAKTVKNDPSFVSAQATIDDPDSTKNEKKKAAPVVKRFQDAANDADAAIADAINKKVDDVNVVDKENLLGRGAGKPAKAGEFRELIHKESEEFWEKKDKSDASKVKSSAIFGNKSKFGLDKETLNEIGRSVAHGIVTQVPNAMGSIAGKIDNSKQLETFTSVYKTGIEEAKR